MLQRCVGRGNKIVPGLSLGRKTLKPLKQTGTVRLGAGSSAWYAASCKGCWLKNVRFARAFAQWPRYTGRPRVQIPPVHQSDLEPLCVTMTEGSVGFVRIRVFDGFAS